MIINFRKKQRINNTSGFGIGGVVGGGTECKGLPYTTNEQGEYVIDNSLHSVKDIIAYSSDSNFIISTESISGELNLWELLDTTITESISGDILIYNGSKWINARNVTINSGDYKGY